jgi:hypothetical protein
VKPTHAIPQDSGLPAFGAIHERHLGGMLLGPLCGYTAGSRATFQAWLGERRVALKAYAHDPSAEAALYQALADAGVAGETGPRVPPLLAWDRELRLLVIGWLDGVSVDQLIRLGDGERAGLLAARWIVRASSIRSELGVRYGAAMMLERMQEWVSAMRDAEPALGVEASAVALTLARTQPREGEPRLVHGTLYDRHILDLEDGPGIIDWQRFGSGPLELDAGVFFATLSRHAVAGAALAPAVEKAELAFRDATAGLLDEQALAWYRTCALLHLAQRRVHRHGPARARVLVDEAARHAETLH